MMLDFTAINLLKSDFPLASCVHNICRFYFSVYITIPHKTELHLIRNLH
uniref:Uncharacterized protein n=1 Tax=Anguilla anguilla TaxID=7936 RepID=A0A0E9U1P3_ANGAN